MKVSFGSAYPLGATLESDGVNFAIYSEHASKIKVCFFDPETGHSIEQVELAHKTNHVWHAKIHGIQEGAHYGYRVWGPYAPEQGHRFNPNKLLIDPYARKLSAPVENSDLNFGYQKGHVSDNQNDLIMDERDNSEVVPKCVVVKENVRDSIIDSVNKNVRGSWGQNKENNDKAADIIYEVNVRTYSQGNLHIPKALRGTFAALASESNIEYLKRLGVTCIELMPITAFASESHLHENGLTNVWGYNPVSLFALEPKYCSKESLQEFRLLVNTMHSAGIKVILDVVFNHTAEGDHLGPTLSFKGIDNKSYYSLDSQSPRFYQNFSGCGNSLNVAHPAVIQLLMDCLRYWVVNMGVDGFRFDLASSMMRNHNGQVTNKGYKRHPLLLAIEQDPSLSGVMLIAEPWDLGECGYQLGQFPNRWYEWNDRFRDSVRRFWRGDDGELAEFAKRLHGSHDLLFREGRTARTSINFVTAHDGFCLEDLVSFSEKHNQANGENNRDGCNNNYSANYGAEGVTDDQEILNLRQRQKRNLITSVFIAQGTPMILSGDERSHTQQGNNNAYCQDNEHYWLNWNLLSNEQSSQLTLIQYLVELRKKYSLLTRIDYPHGDLTCQHSGINDIDWFHPSGKRMMAADWESDSLKSFAMMLAKKDDDFSGYLDSEFDLSDGLESENSHTINDDALFCIFNADDQEQPFHLPQFNGDWSMVLCTYGWPKRQETIPNEILIEAKTCKILSFKKAERLVAA